MEPENFTLLYQDTAAANWDMGSCGSQTTFNSGRAILAAAADVRDQLLDAAAAELEADREDLELAEGHVRVKGSPDRSVSIADLAGRRHDPREGLGRRPRGPDGRHGRMRRPSRERDVRRPAADHPGGAREGRSRDRRGPRPQGGRGARLGRHPQPDGRRRPGDRRRRDGGRPRALRGHRCSTTTAGSGTRTCSTTSSSPAPTLPRSRSTGCRSRPRTPARVAPRASVSPRRSRPPARSRTRSPRCSGRRVRQLPMTPERVWAASARGRVVTRTFTSAATVEDALDALGSGARPVAGGTDLVVGARQGKAPLPEAIVAIDRIDALEGIVEDRRRTASRRARHARGDRRERRDPCAVHRPRRRLRDRRLPRDPRARHDRRQRDERLAGDGHRRAAAVLRRVGRACGRRPGSGRCRSTSSGPDRERPRPIRTELLVRDRRSGAGPGDRLRVRPPRVPPPDGDRGRRRDRRRAPRRRIGRRRPYRDHGARSDDPPRPGGGGRRSPAPTAATTRSRPPPEPWRPAPRRSPTSGRRPSTDRRWPR